VGLADAVRAVLTGRAPAAARARTVPGQVLAVRDRPTAQVVVSESSQVDGVQRRDLASDEIGWRLRNGRMLGSVGSVRVDHESALRHSGVWACLRLRANLESSLPIDAYLRLGQVQVEVDLPIVLDEPFPGVDIGEHMYSSRVDLDRYGNSVGIIREWSQLGLPMVIELAPMSEVTALCNGTQVKVWRICGQEYLPREIWHERQNTIGGWPLGLSPVAYGAWSIGGYLSAQEFVTDWFMGGAAPSGVLRNTQEDELDDDVVEAAKARFKLATAGRDVFVTGADWEWTPAAMDAASAGFLDEREFGITDVCRFFDVPADMIDAPSSGSSITYANITQRNVQTLVTSTGPALRRRERTWSRWAMPRPRFVKFNTDAFLRMDPAQRTQLLLQRVAGKLLTPTEARALDNLPEYTPEQLAELTTFGIIGASSTPAQPAGTGV